MKYHEMDLNADLIKKLTTEQLEEVAALLRCEIIEAVAANGGHLSANLGVVELTLGLLKNFDPLVDDIIFDVGHQTYAYKLLTGRSLAHLRKRGGTAPFSLLEESEYDKCSNGHSSTSLSLALGMAKAKKLAGDTSYTIAFVGDASITNGLSFEALNMIAMEKDLRLIIVLNDNGMSISKATGAVARTFSRLRRSRFYVSRSLSFKNFSNRRGLRWIYRAGKAVKDAFKRLVLRDTIFEALGLTYNGPFDGNAIAKVDFAFEYAKRIGGPVVLHFMTKKGLGYDFAADDSIGCWHGTEPFDIATGKICDANPKLHFSEAAGAKIHRILAEDPSAYLICPAMIYGSRLVECFEDFPERSVDVGIGEEHAVTFAAGLALKGLHPIISIYSTFLQRCYDQLLHDVARMGCPLLIFLERAGLVGPDGSSHQGIFDVGFLKTIPGAIVYQPADLADLEKLCASSDRLFRLHRLIAVRLPRDEFEPGETAASSHPERPASISSQRALVAVGARGEELLKAVDGFDPYLLRTLTAFDDELLESLSNHREIFIYDPYSTEDGLVSSLTMSLASSGSKAVMHTFAIPKEFISFGTIDEQLEMCGLDLPSMLKCLSR